MNKITVIGAGLAGCEAAHKLSSLGFSVRLCEMKPEKRTPAQKSDGFAELVCSNSLKAMRLESAAGLLKEEMRRLGSVTMEAAEKTSVAAGGALAVDRELFSKYITEKIKSDPNIAAEIRRNSFVLRRRCAHYHHGFRGYGQGFYGRAVRPGRGGLYKLPHGAGRVRRLL